MFLMILCETNIGITILSIAINDAAKLSVGVMYEAMLECRFHVSAM